MFDRWKCNSPIKRLLFIPIAIICSVVWLIIELLVFFTGGIIALVSLPIQWIIWGKYPVWNWVGNIMEHHLGNFIFGKESFGGQVAPH